MERPIDATTLRAEFTGNFNDGYYTVAEIKAIIDTAPTLDKDINAPGKWISVKDRLPESSEKYLCYQADAWEPCRINTYRWSVDRQAWLGSDTFSIVERVTHWMPLPPGPEVSE